MEKIFSQQINVKYVRETGLYILFYMYVKNAMKNLLATFEKYNFFSKKM